jgi:hypothetical protein
VIWFDDDDAMVGSGPNVIVTPKSDTCYYAVVRNECQRSVSSPTCVTVSDRPAPEK